MIAENMDVMIPTPNVTEKPLIGPVPKEKRMSAAMRVVILDSTMVLMACL